MDKDEAIVPAIFCGAMCLIVGGVFGAVRALEAVRTEAVQHGAAEWKVNADGTTEFHWLKQSAERDE